MIMPRASGQLLLPVNPLFVALTLLLAFALNLVPLGREPLMPDFVALVLVFWNVHQSRRVGVGLAFMFGLMMDVHDGAVLGQHALAYTLLSFFAITIHRRLLWFTVPSQAVQILPLFFDFDDKRLFAASNINRDKSAIVLLDPATAKEERVVFQHPDVDVSGLAWSRKRKVLTEVQFVTWKSERRFLDAQAQAMQDDLETLLPGYEIDLQSHDKDESIFVVAAWNDRTQGARYLYEATTKKLTKLAEIAPWLDEKQLVEVRPITYEARDGLTIHGYLTLPRGGGKNLPLIVHPHGGPWLRDVWGYNPELQFFASRGYAVLQMNFRGSIGYGRTFWEASFKQWGKKMQDDVSDAVHYAIKQGIADRKRVAIYGGSYGGYATLAGLTFTPELYACGVDYVGVSNLFTFIKTIPPYWKPMLDMMYEMIGDPEKDKTLLAEASPALHADQIRAPLLIAQGAQDPRVNIEESNQMVAALNTRGVDVEYLVKENEGHGFQNEENRFEFYEAMERFLEKHLHQGAPV